MNFMKKIKKTKLLKKVKIKSNTFDKNNNIKFNNLSKKITPFNIKIILIFNQFHLMQIKMKNKKLPLI